MIKFFYVSANPLVYAQFSGDLIQLIGRRAISEFQRQLRVRRKRLRHAVNRRTVDTVGEHARRLAAVIAKGYQTFPQLQPLPLRRLRRSSS